MKLVNRILQLVYPPKCVFCRNLLAEGETSICKSCLELLGAAASGEKAGNWFSGCIWAVPYEDEFREAILRFKFEGCSFYDRAFGRLLAEAIRDKGLRWDVITWAPVSASRRKERGYDQAELLCKQAAMQLDAQPVATLRKLKNNPAQSSLTTALERLDNVKDVYQVIDPALIEGKRVLLIDDIVTTGSTLSECSRTLLAAGADAVWCAALAGRQLP